MSAVMGATVRYRRARGWTVRVSYGGAKRERGGFGHGDAGEAAARKFAAEVEAAHESTDRWDHPDPSLPLPVDQLLRDWLVVYGPLRSERTQLTDRGRIERLASFLGSVEAKRVTERHCRELAADVLRQGKSAALAAGCLSTLRRVLTLAVRSGHLERHPVPTIHEVIRDVMAQGSHEVSRPDAWTLEEMTALLALARRRERHLYPLLLFCFHTGARRGEAIALRWEDVDEAERRVHIRRTARLGSRGTRVPKARRDRFTPLSPGCLTMLRDQRRTLLSAEWVFPAPRGRIWIEGNLARSWGRLRRHAKIEGIRPLPMHCTRHTFCTLALESGTPAKLVSEWVGASVAVIERHYSHVIPRSDYDLSFLAGSVTRAGVGGTEVGRRGTRIG